MTISTAVLAALHAAAAAAAPHEACGLLLGVGDRIEQAVPTANLAADPRIRFEIDPSALIAAHRAARAGGPAVLGYYHSHPAGPARPSPCDAAMASGDRRVWAIIGAGEVRLWRDTASGFEPLALGVVDADTA